METHRPYGRFRLGLALFLVLLAALAIVFIRRYASKSTTLNNEAIELMNQGKYDQALDKLELAVANDPKHMEANYNRGICLAERRRFDEALGSLDLAATLGPNEDKIFFNKGKILWAQQRYREAIAPLQKATELKPNSIDTWLLLGESLYETYLDDFAAKPDAPPSAVLAESAFKTYLQLQSAKPDKRQKAIVEQKLMVLSDPAKHPEVIDKHKARLQEQQPAKP